MKTRDEKKRTGKRLTALVTVLSMVMALMPAFSLHVFAEGEFSGGAGTQNDPYIIQTAADLKKLADDVNSGNGYEGTYFKIPTESYSYIQNNTEKTDGIKAIDIDISEYSPWTPIGTEENPFKGNFNGGNDTNKGNGTRGAIMNFTLKTGADETAQTVQAAGLFGYVENAVIEDVAVRNVTASEVTLTNEYHSIGGVVGFAKDSKVQYCASYGAPNITAVSGDAAVKPLLYVGGVIGGATGSEIFRCINSGTVAVSVDQNSFEGKTFPDMYVGGVIGGVNAISSAASKIHGSENMEAVTVNTPAGVTSDNMKIYTGGVAGGATGIGAGKLEICQCYNNGANAKITLTSGTSLTDKMDGENSVAYVAGIFGYDDADKIIPVHDNQNDAAVTNSVYTDTVTRYAGGIMAGRGDVAWCYNKGQVQSNENASGIGYSVPHNCYSTGMAVPPSSLNGPICIETPEDQTKNYYNYYTSAMLASRSSSWQHYRTNISNVELAWLLQGDDVTHLHWIVDWNNVPILVGGYDVLYPNGNIGDKPLDSWMKSYSNYTPIMDREMVSYARGYAWNIRVSKTRFVTTGEGNDGVDPVTGEDLKLDNSFESFARSTDEQFYKVAFGNFTAVFGGVPSLPATDGKNYVQWQTKPVKDGESATLGEKFTRTAKDATVYAVAQVKYGGNDEEISGSSAYGEGNSISLLGKVEYAQAPDETEGKFTYSVTDAAADDEDITDAKSYFTTSGDNLNVAKDTPAGTYTVSVTATEKTANYTLYDTTAGTDPIDFTVTVKVEKTDPAYTEPTSNTRSYNGESEAVINAGSTSDGTMFYTLTPDDSKSWSRTVPEAMAVGTYTVYWKIIGDSNHNDTEPKRVVGMIIPDSDDPANSIVIMPASDWDYDGETKPLANVVQNPGNVGIEWSTDNSTWTDSIPTAKNVGVYHVYWRTKSNAHGVDKSDDFDVEVRQASLAVTPPVGLKSKYNGEEQELITTKGVVADGKGVIKYSLNPEVNNWSDSNWSEEIPKKTNAGTYTVYYRAFPNDTVNYKDGFDKSKLTSVTATISKLTKADLGDSLDIVPTNGWTYDGSPRKLVNEDETKIPSNLIVQYSVGNGEWTYTIPKAENAGTYNVKWRTAGNDNIEEITGEFTVTVTKRRANVEITPKENWEYNGTKYPLLTDIKKDESIRLTYSVNGGEALTTVPTGQEVGKYTVSVSSQPNNNYETYQGTFIIECTPAKAAGTVTANTLTFNYGRQELVKASGVTNGKMMYKVEGEEDWSETIPSRTDAGTYKVYYYVKGTNSNYSDTEVQSADVTIAKYDPQTTVNKSEGLVYNGEERTLLTVDTAEHHGKVMYKVVGDADYSTDVPKRTKAGTYTVEWKVTDDSERGDGDTNLIEKSGSETITIGKYKAAISYIHAEDLPYTGKEQQLLLEPLTAVNNMGTVKYLVKTDGTEPSGSDTWTTDVPKATDAGVYKVWFKIEGDENIEDVAPDGINVEITKAVPIVNVTVKAALKYNNAEQELIAANPTVKYVNDAPGGGTILYAVTTTDSDTAPAASYWSEEQPKESASGTYYVWFKFAGDKNTEDAAPKRYTSVISDGKVPEVTIIGTTLTYKADENMNGISQKLISGELDGVSIEAIAAGKIKYWFTKINAEETPATPPADTNNSAWKTEIPEGINAGDYHIWYYVPAEGENIAVGPARVDAKINKAPPVPYDGSFTVEYGKAIHEIEFEEKPYGEYAWFHFDDDFQLKTVGTYNYPAYFTDASNNYQDGVVQVPITVTATKEDTPDIKIDYIAEKLIGFDPTKAYTLWDNIGHTDSTSLTIPDEHMDNTDAKIVLKASTDHTTDSDAQELVIPKRPDAPKTSENGGPITVLQTEFLTALGRVEGISDKMEYSIGDSGTWIDGDGSELSLPQNTDLQVRFKAVADTSFKSLPLRVKIEDFAGGRKPVAFGIDADIDYPGHAIVLEPNTKYTITDADGNKHRIETDKDGKTPIEEDWHTTTVKIVRNGDILYTVDSEPKDLYIPKRPDMQKPSDDEGKITNVYKTDEYRLASGTDKDYKPVETDGATQEVTPGIYVARIKATDSHFSSSPKEVPVREKTPNPSIDYKKETLKKLNPNSEYIITEPDGNKVTVVSDENGEIPIRENWFGTIDDDGNEVSNTITIVKKGAIEVLNSKEKDVTIIPRPVMEKPDSKDSKIIGVDKSMEYRLAASEDDDDYTTVEAPTETEVVEPDVYEVRIKATDVTFASLPEEVTVYPLSVPEGNIDYPEVKIKDLEPGEDYTVIDENGDEETFTADEDGKIPVKEEWMGTDIEIIRNGDDTTPDSAPQSLSIPTRLDPPKPDSKNSKITNVDPTMEYRPAVSEDDSDYTTVENATETRVVDPGDYVVRRKATETRFPSLPANVTVTNASQAEPTAEPTAKPTAEPTDTPRPAAPGGNTRGGGTRTVTTAAATAAPSSDTEPTSAPDGDNSDNTVPELNKTDHFAYISGYDDGTFKPDRTITRGEVAAVFARLMTDSMNTDKTYTPSFPDLSADMYFYSQVGYLEKYGIVTGYEDGTFRPWENVTRTEFAVIASKFAELSDTEENMFSDVDDDFWGKPFILLAHKNGWVNGYEDGTFRPKEFITRAEVVSIVNRMLERSCDTEFAQNNADKLNVFGDVAQGHWAYNDILEAANGHLYVTEDGSEAWTDLI